MRMASYMISFIWSPSSRAKENACIHSMAGEASSSSWWEIPATSVSTHDSINKWPPPSRRYSSPYDQDPASSFTNIPGLSMSSSSANISSEPVQSQLWNQALLNVGGGRDTLNHHHNDNESFLQPLNSKSLTTDQIFHGANDYLSSPLSLSSLEKLSRLQVERLSSNTSDMAINWSLAPPNPHLDHPLSPSVSSLPVTSLLADRYSTLNLADVKHDRLRSSYLSCSYDGITIKGETNDQHQETSINSKLCPNELLWTGTRSLSDGISFTGCLNKPLLEGSASSNRRNGRTFTATSEGKRKRPDYSSEILLKKSKHENSTASSTKAPKMKLTDKITALQQLVSPFGKTDTASVLFETYNCIKILHEQVQLLSDPYIKSSGSKDHSGWGEMARKGIAETNLDLRSKGLCLVPISCIPEDHKENCGLDYWVPAYRTSLYR
ncbi:transcription factor bHLH111-like isoform X1 [Zingiber officinale]|uniref:BHLH domain-containing protein n=1 Tax=Zingiber officinale TaxID=94328 RepID=A0A8J5ES44_ZINOF|nr:transcription factor bHLH111-like isoform X1 [Zingiber officinale]KAG6474905.1 hypothetical protein ZIOFF_064121 [Zingiber officinale]